MKANARKNTRRSKLATALNTDLSHKITFKIDLRGSEFVDLYQNFPYLSCLLHRASAR